MSVLLSGCDGVVFTVSEACPLPMIELGSTKHAASTRLAGIVQVKLIGMVKLVATFTVTLEIAADPRVAVTPGEDSEKSEKESGTAVEMDSA